MSLLDHMPHLATAKRLVITKGSIGGSKATPGAVVFSGVSCWRQPAGDSEITKAAARGITITDKVYFNADPELDENHVLEIGGKSYDVISYSEPDAGAGIGPPYRIMVNRTTRDT